MNYCGKCIIHNLASLSFVVFEGAVFNTVVLHKTQDGRRTFNNPALY